ncbi:hypothetical protein HK096_007790, partial [Nowakowskiella sp. JEL0078]
MVIDSESQVLYVFGGRIITSDANQNFLYSGMYSYEILTGRWRMICNDTSQPENAIQLKSRIGHSMLLNPATRELYIFAGQRKKDYLSDFYIYEIDTDTIYECSRDYSKQSGPDAGFTQRATIDPELGEFYVLSGLMREKTTAQETMKNSFWVYNIRKDKWARVYQNENTGTDYWNLMADKEPCPRFAHQLVYDNVLRRVKFYVRRQRFREICESSNDSLSGKSVFPDLKALNYLQREVSAVVDHKNEEESKEFRELTTLLFSNSLNQLNFNSAQSNGLNSPYFPRSNAPSSKLPINWSQKPEIDSKNTNLKSEMSFANRDDFSQVGGMGGIPSVSDYLPNVGFGKPVPGPSTLADETFQTRTQLFERLLLFFPSSIREPTNNL